MIETRDLKYQYPGGQEIHFPDLTVRQGERFLLLGESGSGKTTLLHLIGGLLSQYAGSLKILETEIHTLKGTALDHFRGHHIGFVFQRHHLIEAFSVLDNLLIINYLGGIRANRSYAMELLAELGIDHKAHARVSTLSQGQAQRVAIARALMNKPKLILADEPTSALDTRNSIKVSELLAQSAERHGATLFIATHDQRLKSEFANQINLSTP